MAAIDQTIRLSDGRTLSYAEYGDPKGKPVLYMHGNPGCRQDPQLFTPGCLEQFGIRLIAPDRPGVGLSSYQPGRKMLDWPADVGALADALRIDRFSVLAVSGGGPYGAVCALKLRERVSMTFIASGVGPFDRPELLRGMGPGRYFFTAARLHPVLGAAILALMQMGMKSMKTNTDSSSTGGMPEADMAVMRDPRVSAVFFGLIDESMRMGRRGLAYDASLIARPWGFPLNEIASPVHLWHGDADINVPVAMARFVAGQIPGCRSRYFPGEGHFSLIINHQDEILQMLAGE